MEINTYGYVRADGYICIGKSNGNFKFLSPKSYSRYRMSSHLARIKKRAEEKSLPFELDARYLVSIWPEDGKCPATGISLSRGGKDGNQGPTDDSPSLDRIIPELGYVRGNVQWLSKLANSIKQNATPEQIVAVGEFCMRQATTVAPTHH